MKKLSKNFTPSCIHDNKELAYSSTGYILPCCWCDSGFILDDDDFKNIVQDKFKVENVENVSEILESDEWIDFFKFEKIPVVCQKYCGGGSRYRQGHPRKSKKVIYE
jgi:hypothetical protein